MTDRDEEVKHAWVIMRKNECDLIVNDMDERSCQTDLRGTTLALREHGLTCLLRR